MECLNMKILCFGVILVLTIVFGSFHEAVAEDCNGMSGLLIARIRNLEKRMDLDLKIMKSELKRELNSGKKRRSNGDSTLLYEIRTIQTSMQQLFSGLETFKTELLLRQQNVTANLLGTVASLQGDVRTLTSKVDSMQMKLSRVDESVANLTKSVEDIDIEIIDSTEPPLTTQTTSFYNYTAPPPLSGAVRLVGNSGTTNAGTVEVYADGRWGSICDDDWDRDDAEVVCRMLGYGTVIGVYGEARYGQSSSADIHLDGIDCTGDETSILDCRHNGIGNTDCSHAEDAGVECANPQTTTYSDGIQYRLVDGPDSYAGRVEVRYQGEWGTVCDDEFDDSEATVVCRSLGISDRGLARIEAFYGTGSGSILMDGLQCTGSERFLHDCDFNGWRVSDCSHGEDASVTCEAGGGFTTPGMTTMPSGVQYRLVGPNPYAGRVEVYYGGEWGTVCDDGFDEREAIVLCSLMGYKLRDITPVVKTEAYYGSGSGPIHMDDLNCQGTESSLEQCPFPGWDVQNCGHSEDVGVNCYGDGGSTPPPLTTTSTSRTTAEPVLVRLVDGPSELSGRVEVYRDGVWGTVCDDDFDYKEAAVICRSLGFSGGVSYQEAKFGRGTGPIWLDDLKCQGGESSLGDCRFNGWNNSNCGHEEDASVGCEPAPTTVATTTSSAAAMIRLADGPGSWEGRVEVYHDNEWGTVCDDEFDNNEAKIVCRMLGLKGGKAFQGSEKYPPGSGTILMDDLMCTGNESSLFDCGFNGWGVSNCGHGEDAGVQCVMPVRVESIRLVDGESENVGRVEITVNGANGTICDDDFDYKAATVVCRMLGYMNGGESYIEARYGEGSGQVILDDVICTGNESSLAECSHRQPFTSNCEHDEDVSVRCFLPNTSTTFEPFVNFTEISPFTPEFVNFTEYIPETESAGSNVTGDQPEDLMKSAPGSPPPNIRGRPVGNNTVLIEWNESRTSNQSIQGYKIFYTTDPSYPLALWVSVVAAAESRAANITGLVSNTTYSFAILAFNTYGSGPISQLIQVFTRSWSHKGVPLQLLNAIALAISPNEIRMRISWDPIERKRDDVITYVVQYNDSEARELGSLTFYRAPGLGEVDVTLADLTPDTIYHIQVIGSGYLGEVARSDIIQARTPAFIPGPPEEVQVQVINGTGIYVTWRPPLEEVGSGIIRGYAVYVVEVNELDNPIMAENEEETLDGNTHELAIFGLTPSARYRLQVAGYTRRGGGIRSSPAYVTVEGGVGRITDPPKDMKVADDHIVSFFCKASGYPPLKFYWEKAGKRLGDRKAGRYQVFSMPNGTVLRIQPVRGKRDNRTFTCVATNKHGEVRASAVLSVYPSSLTDDLPSGYPRIVENPVLKTVEKDHAVTLSCRATAGGPSNPPEIYWLKDEMPLNTKDPRLHISDEGTLTIERCLESDQGKYECVAENAVGVAYSFAAFLYVKDSVELNEVRQTKRI